MFYAAFIPVLCVLSFLFIYISKKKSAVVLECAMKCFTVAFVVLTMLDNFLPDLFMCTHEMDTLKTMEGAATHGIVRWLNLVSFTVLPIAVFQKNKYFERIASFFCLPVALVNVGCLYKYMEYFTANSYSGLQTVRVLPQAFKDFLIREDFRAVFFGLTCLCQLIALILLTYANLKKLSVPIKELVSSVLILIGVIYISLPIYVPQYLFGHVDVMIVRFSGVHFMWMAIIVAILLALYLGFRKSTYETKYLLLVALSWALMLQFSQMYTASSELNIMKLPLQLCNLGSYLTLFMLLTKSEKLYHFTLVVNVVGALLAIVVLDIGADISHVTRLWVVHFLVEHTKVFIIPILCLLLGIFKPIDKHSIKHFSIGFSAYYLFIFILGTVSNGLYRLNEGKDIQNFFYANHLFMFDKDVARGLVGFTDPLFDSCVVKLGAFEIYPVAQVCVYLIYMAICLLIYWLIYALTKRHLKAQAKKTALSDDLK